MPYARLLERIELASAAINADRREALERTLLGGWLALRAAGSRSDWLEFRDAMLGENSDGDAGDVTADEALEIASRIAAMDTGGGEARGDL